MCITSTVNPQMFGDEVTALLLSTHTKKISVLDLTKQYNLVFRNPTNKSSAGNLLPISPADLEESLRKMPGFNVRSRQREGGGGHVLCTVGWCFNLFGTVGWSFNLFGSWSMCDV